MKLQTFFEKSDQCADAPDAVADRAAVPRWVRARALLRIGGRLDARCSPSLLFLVPAARDWLPFTNRTASPDILCKGRYETGQIRPI